MFSQTDVEWERLPARSQDVSVTNPFLASQTSSKNHHYSKLFPGKRTPKRKLNPLKIKKQTRSTPLEAGFYFKAVTSTLRCTETTSVLHFHNGAIDNRYFVSDDHVNVSGVIIAKPKAWL